MTNRVPAGGAGRAGPAWPAGTARGCRSSLRGGDGGGEAQKSWTRRKRNRVIPPVTTRRGRDQLEAVGTSSPCSKLGASPSVPPAGASPDAASGLVLPARWRGTSGWGRGTAREKPKKPERG